MDKKINTTGALTFIIFLSGVVGVLIWLTNQQYTDTVQEAAMPTAPVEMQKSNVSQQAPVTVSQAAEVAPCIKRYFEGKENISAWKSEKDNEDMGDVIIIEVSKADAKELPGSGIAGETFRLIDATPGLKEELASASENNPATFTIKGFAYNCQDMSEMSLNIPQISFKK